MKKSIEARRYRRETINLIQNRIDLSYQLPVSFKVQKKDDRTIVDIESVFYIFPNKKQLFQEVLSKKNIGFLDIGPLISQKAQMAHYV